VIVAAGLDLGTTRVKAGLLDGGGRLAETFSAPAPPLAGEGAVRESPAGAYRTAAEQVLAAALARAPAGTPIGIASQRSSFVLWDERSGDPVTPLLSWQDRRAAAWCAARRDREEEVRRRTGLPLSPHYAGPKLALLLEERADLRREAAQGRLRFGTTETFLLRSWSRPRRHETDLTMAARTLLADPQGGTWSPDLLALFGVPAALLPEIAPTAGRATALARGSEIRASLADQAAGALVALGDLGDAWVSLGTGVFVLRGARSFAERRAGYLTGPILAGPGGGRHALEGTVNGGAAAADRFAAGPTGFPGRDPAPEAFCVPDDAGLGSPHWRPGWRLVLSPAAGGLAAADARRVVLEGVLFRVRELIEDLFPDAPPARVRVAGGLARERGLCAALAACLGREIERMLEADLSLLGAARLAAGTEPGGPADAETIPPGPDGDYLRGKYAAWRSWLRDLLERAPT
jgi:glycerol kinase